VRVSNLWGWCWSAGAAVLDLMSSWVSHLPPEKRYSRVMGHGMNAQVGHLGRLRG